MLYFRLCITLLVLLQTANAANILFYWAISTYSHRIVVWPLVEALVEKGHNVTFLSPFPPKSPNPKVTEIYKEEFLWFLQRKPEPGVKPVTLVDLRMANAHRGVWDNLPVNGIEACEVVTKNPDIVNWVKSAHYDLVIIDALFNDCALGLSYKFKAPHISFGTTSMYMWYFDILGLQMETSWIPDLQMGYPQAMSFFQRVSNTIRPLQWYFKRHWITFPKVEKMLKDTFDMPDMPPLKELEREASLVFLNSHYSLDYARSLPPLVVPVGGMQCHNKTRPLSKEIEDFIEAGGDNGFIYVSFGSVVDFSTAVPHHIRNIFFQAFENSSVRFVWKWDAEIPSDMPKNVIPTQWIAQQDVLAHPKIRAFITHGGLLSVQEATYNSVPLISFPLFAEQEYNAEIMVNRGYGIRLDLPELTQSKLENAINSILTDARYKMKIEEVSRMFKERSISPLDNAVWWTEYILKNKEAPNYLRPLGANQTWYTRRGLDVWLFVFISLLSLFIITSIVTIKLLQTLSYYFSGFSIISKPLLIKKAL